MSKLNLGIVGAGMIVYDFLSMYKQVGGLHLAYIVATQNESEKLQKLCSDYGIDKYYVDFDEALNDDVDALYIAVPNHLHYIFAKKALLANKNVICEKPFTSNYSEALELAKLAREKGLIIVEAVTTHYFPNMEMIREEIKNLGNIKSVVMNYSQYSSRYLNFKEGEVLPAFDPNKAGGAIMDINIYNVNFVVNLFGMPRNIDYFANIERGIDVSGTLILDYGSFKCTLVGSKDSKAPYSVSVQGDQKSLLMDTPVNMLYHFKTCDNANRNELSTYSGNYSSYNDEQKHRMYYEFVEFSRMISEKDFNSCEKALKRTLEVMEIQTIARKKAGIEFPTDK